MRSRLAEFGLELPEPLEPRGRYVPAVRDGTRLWVSGHTDRPPGGLATRGLVGDDLDVDGARQAARRAAANVIAAALGAADPSELAGVVFLRGYVRASDDFAEHPAVVDAASEVLEHVFGKRGHARAAVGVASLPGQACVELEAVLRIVR